MIRLHMKTIIKALTVIYFICSLIYIFRHVLLPFNLESELRISLNEKHSLEESVDCYSGVQCQYPDEKLDFRIIVLTYNRTESLNKLLNSIAELYVDGDVGAVEIWVDRNKETNEVSERVVAAAQRFRWIQGPVRVHVQPHHVGIIGQWIDTWRPNATGDPNELVMFLEDDMSLSPFAYRWLKAAHLFYADRSDMAGITLHSEGIIVATNGNVLVPPPRKVAYLYRHVSSWGFAPRARIWRDFQDWYHTISKNSTFRPYVDGLISTRWYKIFEKRGTADSMWTMWFIYYCNERKLYTLYNNLSGNRNRNNTCLTVNRREPGLHYFRNFTDNTPLLLWKWTDDLIRFERNIKKLEFNGRPIATGKLL